MIELGSTGATPVTVLTGFLGAGKTTLLNRILTGKHGLRVAVLVNDFGSINIDADLVVGVEDGVMSLADGCVCCSIRDDLIETVETVLSRPERPEYILLESSGVADPSGIAMTFTDMKFRDRIRLDSITCVVDAEQIFAAPEQMELKLRQMAFSDMIILNKVDLVGRDDVKKMHDWLGSRFARYRLIEAVKADVPLEILLSVGRFDAMKLTAPEGSPCGHGTERGCTEPSHDHHASVDGRAHTAEFSTTSYETDTPISLETLREKIKKLPGAIYRVKGVVRSTEEPDNRVILQVVGKRCDVTLEEPWGERAPRTRVVAIGAPGIVNRSTLADIFG